MRRFIKLMMCGSFVAMLLIGCGNSEDSKITYSAKFQGQSDDFTIKDNVNGYYMPRDKQAYETHEFEITWKNDNASRDVGVTFNEYDDVYSIVHSNSYDKDVKMEKTKQASGTRVVNYTFEDVLPTKTKKLLITIEQMTDAGNAPQEIMLTRVAGE